MGLLDTLPETVLIRQLCLFMHNTWRTYRKELLPKENLHGHVPVTVIGMLARPRIRPPRTWQIRNKIQEMLSSNLNEWGQSHLKDHLPAHTWNLNPKQRVVQIQNQVLRIPSGQTKGLSLITDGFPKSQLLNHLTILLLLRLFYLINRIWSGNE